MFTITNEAENYISDLFDKQDDTGLALKIEIEMPATPVAKVSFNFCFSKDLPQSYQKFEYKGFDAYIDISNLDYLFGSSIAFKGDGATRHLTILAPNAKGSPPDDNDSLEEKIKYTIIADINPSLSSHNGFVELIEIKADNSIILNFGGGCQGCSGVKMTLKSGVEAQLRSKYPEINQILDVTDHSVTDNAYM